MRIVALADSLALPRNEPPDLLRWEETWPFRLEVSLAVRGIEAEVINCGARARTAPSLLDDFEEHVRLKEPDVVVIQVGIVDCAPRVFSRLEHTLLKHIPGAVRQPLIRYRSSRRDEMTARSPLSKVYTAPDRFSAALRSFRDRARELPRPPRLLAIPVLASAALLQKARAYVGNISLYNSLLRNTGIESVNAALTTIREPGQFCSDGYHLSSTGSLVLADLLASVVVQDPS